MKKWFKNALEAFINTDIRTIKNYTLKFAQEVTKALLNDDKDEIERLIDNSIEVRDKLQINEIIDKNKEFYYGYWYAYENIANRMADHKEINDDIHTIIESNEKLRSLVKFLGKEKAAKQKDIAGYLGQKPNELANFMETDYVKKSDILTKNKIGRNVIYSLNAKGRKYYTDKNSGAKNNYSKEDIYNIINYIETNDTTDERFFKESPGLDEDIFKRIYSLVISKELSEGSKYKEDIYLKLQNKIPKEDRIRNFKVPKNREIQNKYGTQKPEELVPAS